VAAPQPRGNRCGCPEKNQIESRPCEKAAHAPPPRARRTPRSARDQEEQARQPNLRPPAAHRHSKFRGPCTRQQTTYFSWFLSARERRQVHGYLVAFHQNSAKLRWDGSTAACLCDDEPSPGHAPVACGQYQKTRVRGRCEMPVPPLACAEELATRRRGRCPT